MNEVSLKLPLRSVRIMRATKEAGLHLLISVPSNEQTYKSIKQAVLLKAC